MRAPTSATMGERIAVATRWTLRASSGAVNCTFTEPYGTETGAMPVGAVGLRCPIRSGRRRSARSGGAVSDQQMPVGLVGGQASAVPASGAAIENASAKTKRTVVTARRIDILVGPPGPTG